MPRPGAGFFIEHLYESVFGPSEGPSAVAPSPWHRQDILASDLRERAHEQFFSRSRVAHVCLDEVLTEGAAWSLLESLESARFVRVEQAGGSFSQLSAVAGELGAFVEWLGSQEGLRFHFGLIGWAPIPPGDQVEIQVLTTRLSGGDRIAPHATPEREGIIAVYDLSAGWLPELGGALSFLRSPREIELRVVPRFNSLLVFRPSGAVAEIEAVTEGSGTRHRYNVVVSYLARGPSPVERVASSSASQGGSG